MNESFLQKKCNVKFSTGIFFSEWLWNYVWIWYLYTSELPKNYIQLAQGIAFNLACYSSSSGWRPSCQATLVQALSAQQGSGSRTHWFLKILTPALHRISFWAAFWQLKKPMWHSSRQCKRGYWPVGCFASIPTTVPPHTQHTMQTFTFLPFLYSKLSIRFHHILLSNYIKKMIVRVESIMHALGQRPKAMKSERAESFNTHK